MAMLRLARRRSRSDLLRLIVSARSPADLYYADELPGPETTVVYTRAAPSGWSRPIRRLSQDDLAGQVAVDATAYVCGSPAFADSVTALLIDDQVPTDRIRVERFGPTM
jgi:ferredoxin-NADP reductase